MICKKVSKVKSISKTKPTKTSKSKQLIKSRRNCATTQSSPSGVNNIKGKTKKNSSTDKRNSSVKDLKKDKSRQSNGQKEAKTKKSPIVAKKTAKNSAKSKKSSKIKKIKEVVKKVKSKTSDKVNLVIKRSLRNNCKIEPDTYLNNLNELKTKHSSDYKNKNVKQNFDTKALSLKNDKNLIVNNECRKSSKNLCSKLFPTLDSIKLIDRKNSNSKEDSKPKLRNQIKREEESPKVIKSMAKSKAMKDNEKKNKISNDSKNKKVKNNRQSKNSKQSNKKVIKENKPTAKKNKKCEPKAKQKNGLTLGKHGHRLASLNAIAKVRLLCENDTEKSESIDRYEDRSKDKQMEKKKKNDSKNDRKTGTKAKKCESKSKKNDCKALVPVDNRKTVAIPKKRKLLDDSVEIIDTRSCKRMASLNASAIMAASYSPERVKRSKSVESNHSNNSVEMVREMQTFSQTVSRYEISPTVTAINGIHVNQVSHQKSVIFSAQKHETIETVKQMKVSNKIKDRLLGIAKLERQEKAKLKRLEKKNQRVSRNDNQTDLLINPEVSGFQATNVQVTKVTQINSSQGVKCVDKDKKKTNHQINSILNSDSSVVHKYQVQTKATIQMQTTFNSNTGSSIANVATLTAPPAAVNMTNTAAPRMQIHLTDTPIIPAIAASGQPTYYSLATNNPAVVQVHNNFPALGPSTSNPALNPMQIISLSEPYQQHYSSAFSVPHFATHTHPTQNPFTAYLNPNLYQPAGPLLQGFSPATDPCLIHKPIPFHPPAPQVNHIHTSPQFSNASPSGQQFASELSGQPFATNPQFYPQMQSPLVRPPQTVFFQAMPQNNGTAFTLLNPGVHYSHPTFISEQMTTNRENPILTNETNFLDLNKIISDNTSNSNNVMPGKRSSAQTSNASALPQQTISTSSQCSPQTRPEANRRQETENYCLTTNQSMTTSHNNRLNDISDNLNKKSNKSEKCHKKKKSLLLNSSSVRNEDVIRNRNSSQLLSAKQNVCESVGDKSGKNVCMPSNSNKTNSVGKNKSIKTACVQVSPSLPLTTASPSLSTQTESSSKKVSKKRFAHGWSWEGSPQHKYVYLNNEEQSHLRKCYPAIRHNEGDIIKVRDCVLLRSGPRKTDLPFVAKISALWESPEGEMMMSLLWYYRPEHTDLEYYSNQMCAEIFASKHRDINSVACIDDKCYVLTYNEFCRYRRSKLANQWTSCPSLTASIVPASEEPYPRAHRLPPPRVFPELVFCCRKVYDYRQKRILKNPI